MRENLCRHSMLLSQRTYLPKTINQSPKGTSCFHFPPCSPLSWNRHKADGTCVTVEFS